MVVNSVTHFAEQEGVAIGLPKTYLALNGCTNFGGYIWISVESNSCSSDATGQSAGMAGLLYSAARNAVDKGLIKPDSSGQPLSAEEAKQLFRLGAHDVDFSTPQPPFPPQQLRNHAAALATLRDDSGVGPDNGVRSNQQQRRDPPRRPRAHPP